MRVLFINRATAHTVFGGDTVQMMGTAAALRRLGVAIDFYQQDQPVDYTCYDLIHFFNLSRPDTILYHLEQANLPAVVATIYMDYSYYRFAEVRPVVKWVSILLGTHAIEYGKALYKHFKGSEKLKSKYYLLHGQRRSIAKVLRSVQLLLPNSDSETQRLHAHFDFATPCQTIFNGVDLQMFAGATQAERDEKMVFCAARIEPMKNQYKAIVALNNTGYQLYLAGAPAPNHLQYYERCKAIAGPNIHFLGHLSQEALLHYYQRSAVHILPSRFETTGLASLEAAYMGCKIVVSDKGDTSDYFKDHAVFCDPECPQSILEAVNRAAAMPYDHQLRLKIEADYNWDAIAAQLLEAYKNVLKSKRA